MAGKSKPARDLDWKNSLALGAGGLVLLVALVFAFLQWRDNSPQPLRATIKLQNQCGLIDDAFVVVSTDGASAEFVNGVAVLQTRSDQRVYLKASSRYPAFGFESPPVRVKERMTLAAQCSSTDRTIEAMREQFEKKK